MKKIEITSLFIPTTNNQRTIRILLPDKYDENKKSYPVLYMHDGQNLFEDDIAYGGHSWKIYETLHMLIEKNLASEIIIVGIDNSNLRLFEYSPWKASNEIKIRDAIDVGGLGDVYADFIVNHVKPFIDKNYRTMNDYQNTMIAGSSMGAYISCYIAIKYPNIFMNVGVFSLASWFNEESFLEFIEQAEIDPHQRYFISIGRNESSNQSITDFNTIYLQNSRHLCSLLKHKDIGDVLYIETDDQHNELAWQKVFADFIRFINKKS
ncbi:MAG: alpha/beta hydrolase [Acholeplasmataceae bacterium]|nr:alpha/beta hydrolase [Acholeplasmataceae bacterium]